MTSRLSTRLATCAAVSAALAGSALAQGTNHPLNNQWLEFVKDNSMLGPNPTAISDGNNETDMIWGDVDQDSWVDVVVVRKQPWTSAGKRTNLLLMNENGVLEDRTGLYATDSTVGGDNGFNTPTNDRDVVLADFDGDGWEDFVIATTLSDGDPKHIGHPRIYMNKGLDGSNNWLGFRFENARFPQMVSFTTGNPTNPRFCSVAAGDLTGNGRPDLFFGDYDSSGAGGLNQPAGADMNDRYIVNDGNGNFADESQLRATSGMLLSAFGMATEIHDINQDGQMDVIKDSALNPPQNVRVLYNNLNDTATAEGYFNVEQIVHVFAPYHIDVNDLNRDGRLDLIVSDDNADRYRLNLGNDALGRVIWSDAFQFGWAGNGEDDGFGSNNLIVDLDNDEWPDVLIADVDVDIEGGNRRLHIYHNQGGAIGGNITLVHEREQNSDGGGGPFGGSATENGWLGVVGMLDGDLESTHDVAVFDIDKDGDNDMLVSRAAGTDVWRNELNTQPLVCQTDLGFGGPGTSLANMCGTGLGTGQSSELTLRFAEANSVSLLAVGLLNSPTPIFGGTLVPVDLQLLLPFATSPAGAATAGIINGGHPASPAVYFQWVTLDPDFVDGLDFSNAIEAQYLP